MTDSKYADALRGAKAELIRAIMDRDKLSLEIVRLQQLVKALTYQAYKTDQADTESQDAIGFTETVLIIIRTSNEELTARDIRDRLLRLGYDLTKYANPLGFVHSVLGRLEAQGKIRQSAPGAYVFGSSPFFRALRRTGFADPEHSDPLPGVATEDATRALGVGPAQPDDLIPSGLPPPPKPGVVKPPRK